MNAGLAPVVVVGAGVAGLSVALAAAPRPVLLLSRGDGSEGSTALAQGGIAAALATGDSVADHVADTLRAGCRHNSPRLVEWLCTEAAAAIERLRGLGMPFDHDGDGLRLALEGGHQRARVVHAGGDATGAVLAHTLVQAVRREHRRIQWWHGDCDGLVLRNGRVTGVRMRRDCGAVEVCDDAAAVVLATGGPGHLFRATTQPASADGSGLALGLAAGAPGRDLEMLQFHPTALDVGLAGRRLPLLSEAIRGAGAVLVDGAGRRLLTGPGGDLGPRDQVARAVADARASRGGAWLDARAIGRDWPARFPGVFESLAGFGIDPRVDLVAVREAVHFHMGGLAAGADGHTRIPGLMAVGEVACNRVHGANRLASNSLLEGLVFGQRVGCWLAATREPLPTGRPRLVGRGPDPGAAVRERIAQLLDTAMGPRRTLTRLHDARAQLRRLKGPKGGWPARVALAMVEAAGARASCLGAHCMAPAGLHGRAA